MSETTFLRIERRAGDLVAVFSSDQSKWISTSLSTGYWDDGTFYLNEESLLSRINNLEANGHDVSEERIALAEMRCHAKGNNNAKN